MIKKFALAIALLFAVPFLAHAQLSRWENFTDMKTVNAVVTIPGTNTAYVVSQGGMYVTDINSGNIVKKYTNINGLISIELSAVTIDNNNRLWIGALDGSLMIYDIANGSFKYIYDIKNSSEANRSINAFRLSGNFMYVATGYGIQKISTSNFTFVDAPYKQLGGLGQSRVNSLTILNNFLFAATETGVAWADFNTQNLNNPNSWNIYNAAPLNEKVRTVETFDNKVFAGSETGCLFYDGSNWSAYPEGTISAGNTKSIKAIGSNIYIISGNTVYTAPSSNLSAVTQFLPPASYSVLGVDNNLNPIAGTTNNGIFARVGNANYSFLFPNGPFKNSFDDITVDENGILWSAGGNGEAGFYRFDGTNWENYNVASHPEIGNNNTFRRIATGFGKVWALSFGGGATLIDGNTITNFNTTNSSLPGIPGTPTFCTPFGGAFDNNGVFWTTVYVTDNGRSLYAFTGSDFIGMPNPGSIGNSPNLESVAIDSYNTKWVISGEGSPRGVYFFNENGTISDFSDDVFGFYNLNDFAVQDVVDIVVDKNNEVWIATDNGVFIINNPLAAIQNPNNKPAPQKMRIISGNLAVPFTEVCKSLTVDILNQKWVGTENNGVFHFSEDGSTLIEQFNTSNSPILSNSVTSIGVSDQTGRAYFGTLKGLSSVSTDAVEPVTEFSDIIMSPNPFLVPAQVDLKIDGLIENSIIKIITLTGEVLDEFESPGGKIATWNNSRNLSLASGVYIVVAFNKDGSQVGKGKFAVVRR